MRYVDRYGFTASIWWVVFGFLVVVKDSRGNRRHVRVYYKRSSAEGAVRRYGSRWHRVRLFGSVDEECL